MGMALAEAEAARTLAEQKALQVQEQFDAQQKELEINRGLLAQMQAAASGSDTDAARTTNSP